MFSFRRGFPTETARVARVLRTLADVRLAVSPRSSMEVTLCVALGRGLRPQLRIG
jgi:hypothetical protein